MVDHCGGNEEVVAMVVVAVVGYSSLVNVVLVTVLGRVAYVFVLEGLWLGVCCVVVVLVAL